MAGPVSGIRYRFHRHFRQAVQLRDVVAWVVEHQAETGQDDWPFKIVFSAPHIRESFNQALAEAKKEKQA